MRGGCPAGSRCRCGGVADGASPLGGGKGHRFHLIPRAAAWAEPDGHDPAATLQRAHPARTLGHASSRMIAETVAQFNALAREKADHVRVSPMPVAVGAMMAGAYIGIGIILALSVGSMASAEYRPLLMGLVFGIALVPVVFSDAELFTGYAFYMTFGLLGRTVRWREVLGAGAYVWIGNLAGTLVLAALFTADGDGTLLAGRQPYLFDYVVHKNDAVPIQLFCRAVLCNWLVCFTIWTAARIENEAAKLIVIACCLLAFVRPHLMISHSLVALRWKLGEARARRYLLCQSIT